jgi:hypothetical protein
MAEEIKEGWWKEKAWIMEYLFKGEEPTAYDLLGAFICNIVLRSPEAVLTAGNLPPRVIHFSINHPKRGRESAVLMVTPMAAFEGEPEEEPDIRLDCDYYDLLRYSVTKRMSWIWYGAGR